jgi:hypothetical protein
MVFQNYTPELEWIDQSDINSRSRVRAHVVRERTRRVSWQEQEIMNNLRKRFRGRVLPSTNASSGVLDEHYAFAASSPEYLGGGRGNPFAQYLIESTTDMLTLLDHCEHWLASAFANDYQLIGDQSYTH